MSGINGDKSRYHRERKQKLARRIRNREMLKNMTEPRKPAVAAASKSKSESE